MISAHHRADPTVIPTPGGSARLPLDPPIEFRVVDVPIAQGSKKHVGHGILVESAKGLDAWRHHVATQAAAATIGRTRLTGPVWCALEFRFRMPRSRSAAVKRRGDAWKGVRPDVDKLIRAVFDALTAGGLIHDDAQIASVQADKLEVFDGWTGVHVQLGELPQR